MPAVSIVIISYNQDCFLEECIKSALAQTYPNKRILVVDNFSSDRKSSIRAREIASRHRVGFVQRNDRVLTKCLNEVLQNSDDCKYLNFVAADDVLIHDKIEKQVKYMECNHDVAACFGNAIRIDDNGRLLGSNKIVGFRKVGFDFVFNNRPNLYAPTGLYRVDALVDVGGYNEDHFIEDLSIYLKLTKKGYLLASIPDPLCLYRIHGNNTHTRYKWMLQEKLKIWDLYAKEPGFKRARQNILLESFSNFGSTNKMEFINLIPKVIFRLDSKYLWYGWLRFLFDWRK